MTALRISTGKAALIAGAVSAGAGLLWCAAAIVTTLATTSTSALAQIPINLVNTLGQWLTVVPGAAFVAGGLGLLAGRAWARYVALLAACAWGVVTLLCVLALGTFFYLENAAFNLTVALSVLVLLNVGGPVPSPAHARYFEKGLYLLSGSVAGLALFGYAALYWWMVSRHPYLLDNPGVVRLAAVDAQGFPGPSAGRALGGVSFLAPRGYRYMNAICSEDRGRSLMLSDPGMKVNLEVSEVTQYDEPGRQLPLLGGVHGFEYGRRYAFERVGVLIMWVKTYWPPTEIDQVELPEWHGFRYRLPTSGKESHIYALWHRATGRAVELAFFAREGGMERPLWDAIASSVRLAGAATGDARFREGAALAKEGRLEEAKFSFSAALHERCGSAPYHFALASALLDSGAAEEARIEAYRTLALSSEYPGAQALYDAASVELARRLREAVPATP